MTTENKTIRTTIMMSKLIYDKVLSHIEETGENLTEFYNRALLNQLENDGDFEIRDLYEEVLENGD